MGLFMEEFKMFLKNAKEGEIYTITGIWLGEKVTHRLESLGMTRGTKLLVINKKRLGAMVIKVRGTRFAIGEGFAQGISVEGGAVNE